MSFQRFGGLRLRSLFIDTSTRGPATRLAETGLAEKKTAVIRNVVLLLVVDSTQVYFLNFATIHSTQLDCFKQRELDCCKASDCLSNSDVSYQVRIRDCPNTRILRLWMLKKTCSVWSVIS